jgi:hypothetical protein
MLSRRLVLSLPLIAVLTGPASLPSAAAGPTDEKKAKAPPQAGKPAPGQQEQVLVEEADVLRQAYIALASANHDYDGHRAKAMAAVKRGVKILGKAVDKHGTPAQKEAVEADEAAILQAEQAARQMQMLHEPQPASDRALRQGRQLLTQVRPTLVHHKQKGVLGDVDAAIQEVRIALKMR